MKETEKWFEEVENNRKARKGICLVAIYKEKVIGWCYGYITPIFKNEKVEEVKKKLIKKFNIPHNKIGYISAIAVSEPYTGMGVGTKLLRDTEIKLKKLGAEIIILGTNNDNKRGMLFFEKNGYSKVAIIKNYKKRKHRTVDQILYIKYLL